MDYIKIKRDDLIKLDDMIVNLDDSDIGLGNEDYTFLGKLMQDCEIAEYEMDVGNVHIKDNTLTFINNNGEFEEYKLIKRKALKNDIVIIVSGDDLSPFNKKHKNRCFVVSEDTREDDWIAEHCIIGNWCLYTNQYLVLEKRYILHIVNY